MVHKFKQIINEVLQAQDFLDNLFSKNNKEFIEYAQIC